jgi:hypothetical protein
VLLAALRERRTTSLPTAGSGAPPPREAEPALHDRLATFYTAGPDLAELAPQIAAPVQEAASLRRYGAPPGGIADDLGALYQALTAAILEQVSGEEP